MLRSKLYGFVAPPSLAIFVDRTGGTGAVTDAVESFIATHNMQAPAALLGSRHDRADYLHRVTVVPHERRHFHDLLATTIGNHVFLGSLASALNMLTGLYVWTMQGRRTINLPLPYWRVDVPTCPDVSDVHPYISKLCEASALLCQYATVARYIGIEATADLSVSFLTTEPYGELLTGFAALIEHVGPDGTVLNDIALLILAMMCEAPHRSREDRDGAFMQRLGAWTRLPPRDARGGLHATAERLWEKGRSGLLSIESQLAPWRARIDTLLTGHTEEVRTIVRGVLSEFDTHAGEMREQIIADPMVYADIARYLDARWVEPLAYSVSADTAPKLSDPVADCRYMRRDLCDRFAMSMAPAKNLPLASPYSHEALWYSSWLIAHEKKFNIEFVLPSARNR